MNTRQLTVALPGCRPAVLTLPQPLTTESLCQLEQALAGILAGLRREMCSEPPDPGLIEYASWMQTLQPSPL